MILITGATGLSGSIVMRELARQQVKVRALFRSRAKADALGPMPNVEWVEGDLSRPETLGRALEGVERALLISSTVEQMAEVQCSFIDACKAARVPARAKSRLSRQSFTPQIRHLPTIRRCMSRRAAKPSIRR